MRNQLDAFSSILEAYDTPLVGTIIRLPLRTKAQAVTSKIVGNDKNTPVSEIVDVFHKFADELVESLLFLRKIHTITLTIDGEVYAKAESKTCSVSKEGWKAWGHQEKEDINAAFNNIFVGSGGRPFVVDFLMDIVNYCGPRKLGVDSTVGSKQKYRYAVSHQLRKGSGNQPLEEWAGSHAHKLFPWTAIATPLQVRSRSV